MPCNVTGGAQVDQLDGQLGDTRSRDVHLVLVHRSLHNKNMNMNSAN